MSPRSLWPLALCIIVVVGLVALSDPRRWAEAAPPPALSVGPLSPAAGVGQPTPEAVASIVYVPIKPTYDPGDVITVTVRIENLVDFYGGSLDWKFDPNAFRVLDADPVRSGVQVTPGTIFKPGSFIAYPVGGQVDNIKGKISFAGTFINPMPAYSGDGSFVIITFEVKSTCGGSLLDLTPDTLKMSDRDGPPPISFQSTGPFFLSARYPYCAYVPYIMRGYDGQ